MSTVLTHKLKFSDKDTNTKKQNKILPDLPTPALPNIASLTSALLAMMNVSR